MSKKTTQIHLILALSLALAACSSDDYLGKPKEVDPNLSRRECY